MLFQARSIPRLLLMLFSCCCCSYCCCFCCHCAPLRQSMSVTVVACETTTKAAWMRDRDGNVCAAFMWVLMRHAPALISPDPPAQLCYYAHTPNRPTCGKCFSLMMPRKISNLYAGFTNCTRTAFSSTSSLSFSSSKHPPDFPLTPRRPH